MPDTNSSLRPFQKFGEAPIVSPKESVKARGRRLGLTKKDLRLPIGGILSLNVRVTELLIAETNAVEVPWIYAARPLYIGKIRGNPVCIIWAAPGAPLAAMVAEDLIACGVTQLVGVGSLGAIQRWVALGDMVIPTIAVRDEGTSHQYLPKTTKALPSKEFVDILAASCRNMNMKHHLGPVWTTDAPYRETPSKIEYFRRRKVLGVEMESAAVFSVGIYRRVRTACVLAAMSNLTKIGRKIGVYPMGPKQALLNATRISLKAMDEAYLILRSPTDEKW